MNRVVVRFGIPLVLASTGLMAFLSQWEDGGKTKHHVYADPLVGVPTACNGITQASSPVDVVVGDYWSAEKCEQIAAWVVEGRQFGLLDCIKVPVHQLTLDALTSHSVNFNVAQTCASRAVGLINEGRYEEGCDALAHKPNGDPAWSYVGTRYVRGLYKRRLAERQMCLQGVRSLHARNPLHGLSHLHTVRGYPV